MYANPRLGYLALCITQHSQPLTDLFAVSVLILRNILGPVVQSVVSLTSSLRVISLTVLVDSIYNNLIFFAEKM